MATSINMYYFTLSHGSLLSLLGSGFLENYFQANQLQEISPNGKGMKKMS